MINPLVTVIVCTYNHENYIEEALNSILRQQVNFKYEIIVVDDCSTDGTRDILKNFAIQKKNVIKFILRTKNWGMRPGREKDFLNKAQGEYIAFCDGDDNWCDEFKMQKHVEFLQENPQFIGIASNVNIINKYGIKIRKNDKFPYQNEHVYTIKDALEGAEIGQIGGTMYRNFFRNMNAVEIERFSNCKMNMDMKLSVTAAMHGDIYYSSDITANYRYVARGNSWNAYAKNRNMNGYYFDAFVSLQEYIYNTYHKRMNVDNRLLDYAYKSLVELKKKPSKNNMKIFVNILNHKYFEKKFLKKYIIRRMIKEFKEKKMNLIYKL